MSWSDLAATVGGNNDSLLTDEMSTGPKAIDDASSDNFLHQEQLCQHVSFKSLPPLGTKDSLEDVRTLRRCAEYPQRHILHSFAKVTAGEKRPRRRLCKNKIKDEKQDPLKKSTSPEGCVYKLRHKVVKEKSFVNFDIHRLGRKIKNRFKTHKKESDEASSKVSSEKINLCEEISASISKRDPHLNSDNSCSDLIQKGAKSFVDIVESFTKLSLDQSDSSNRVRSESLINPRTMEETVESMASESLPEQNNLKLERWVESEVEPHHLCTSDPSNIQTLYTQRKLDFSSGDDVENCLIFDTENASYVSKSLTAQQSQILDSKKRSVQWNREVDVIYYAGDSNGGTVVRREREPLREEADQQARHKEFMEVALRKNFLSSMSAYQFRLVGFPK